jgi:3-methyladenine DNA glycosylase AlkD
MHPYLIPITSVFNQHANAEKAAWSKAYMLDQFGFFGLVTANRRTLSKDYMKQHPLPSLKDLEAIVKECFTLPQREYQYFAVELMAFNKKRWKESNIKLMEHCIVQKSWWDSVDHLASECLTHYFKAFPEQIIPVTSKWNSSNNIWLQRSSIMFQKAFKKNTDTVLLSKYILHCKDSKEFFIRKAIGWALREYSKTDPEWVKQFVKQNKLHPLSEREALKRL